MKRHILFLSYDGITDPLGRSQVLPYICGLSNSGTSFTLISLEKPTAFAEENEAVRRACKTHNIRWIPISYRNAIPVISAIINLLMVYKEIRRLIRAHPPQIIHARSYLPALLAHRIAVKHGIPWVFDMRGFWADERVDAGIWKLSNPLYKRIYLYFKKREKILLQSASQVVSLTQAAISLMEKIVPGTAAKTTVIPCVADFEHFNPQKIPIQQRQEIRHKLGIAENKKIVVYLGSLATWYLPAEMARLFAALYQKDPELHLLIVSRDPAQKLVSQALDSGVPERAITVTQGTRAEIPSLLSICHAGLCFVLPAYSKEASSPVKLAEMWAMNLMVYANPIADVPQLLQKYKCGWLVEPTGSYHDVPLFTLPSSAEPSIRQKVQEDLSLPAAISAYNQVYSKI